jgi:Rrf2 family nitric oxide-sensitive transcriptional repressor
MQLKRYTDYSLRVLIYLGIFPDEVISINKIARGYDISRNHLLKVVNGLAEQQLVTTFRGKHGGLQLAKSPDSINVGAVVDYMEGRNPLIDCRNPTCPILPACTLNVVLDEAKRAFIKSLHRYTLADLLEGKRSQLVELLDSRECVHS